MYPYIIRFSSIAIFVWLIACAPSDKMVIPPFVERRFSTAVSDILLNLVFLFYEAPKYVDILLLAKDPTIALVTYQNPQPSLFICVSITLQDIRFNGLYK